MNWTLDGYNTTESQPKTGASGLTAQDIAIQKQQLARKVSVLCKVQPDVRDIWERVAIKGLFPDSGSATLVTEG
jgi:hypothetical protein